MGQRITAVSFETDGIQVVTVLSTRSGMTIERVLTLQPSEFEAFLSIDTVQKYLVAINPADAIFETIQIPPTDKKLEETLIRVEAGRLHPELGSFACAYQILGDTPSEGRVIRKVACCLISDQTITPILEPFIRYNKTVTQMVATPHILSALVLDELGTTTEPVLCAHDDGQRKTLFLLDSGAVSFSRSISSNGYGWDPLDRQNVSMTLDYCFQALRKRPSRILVLNPTQEEDANQPSPRLEHLKTPAPLQEVPAETLHTALVPLTLAAYLFPAQNDLLPFSYRADRFKQQIFTRTSTLFFGLALLLALMIMFSLISINATEERINSLKMQETGLNELVQAHQALLVEKNSLQPILTSLNENLAATDIPHTLVALNNLKVDTVRLSALALKREKDSVSINFTGTVNSSSYAATQEHFEAYLSSLQSIRGMQNTRKSLEPKGQTFTIEAVYKP